MTYRNQEYILESKNWHFGHRDQALKISAISNTSFSSGFINKDKSGHLYFNLD